MRFTCPAPEYQVRSDRWGDGKFGARRAGGSKFHDGVDIVVIPSWPIVSPIDGRVEKLERPYTSDERWKGIQIANGLVRTEIWYMAPILSIEPGQKVFAGEKVGVAQDISMKYPPREDFDHHMTPHIHFRVSMLPFTVLQNGQYNHHSIIVNPELFLGD